MQVKRRLETVDSPFWISYADLMTALVMLLLIVVTVSMLAIASRPLMERKERERAIGLLWDGIEQRVRAGGLDVTINRGSQTLGFGERARFASDRYQLSPEARQQLQAMVPILLELHQTPAGAAWLKRIHIEGYTDETGVYLYNVHLSLRRAQAVVCALFENIGQDPDSQSRLQRLLMIDGATVTSMKASKEESRRVEVRLEFRAIGDDERAPPASASTRMELGHCPIQFEEEAPRR
jgi:outer membrane protein OmpA-like peptidoglycan-associated protein